MSEQNSNSSARTVFWLSLVVVGMFGFGFAMVPLYNVFCDVTGINGNTSGVKVRASVGEYRVDESRTVKVQFLGNVNQEARWDFAPETFEIEVHPGKLYTAYFNATNLLDEPVVGQAIPSVMPGLAALHFHKTECFCFTQQAFKPREKRHMPVTFMVDPQLPDDIETISLAYTFFDITRTAKNSSQSKPVTGKNPPIAEESINGG